MLTHALNAMPGIESRRPSALAAFLADPRPCVSLIADGVHVAPEVAAFRSTVNEWRQFTEALRSYDRMLAAAADALDALLRLSKDPFAGGGAVSQLGQAALVIRNQVEAIRRSLAAPRPNIGG